MSGHLSSYATGFVTGLLETELTGFPVPVLSIASSFNNQAKRYAIANSFPELAGYVEHPCMLSYRCGLATNLVRKVIENAPVICDLVSNALR